jgi:hypothetical protein
VADHAARVTSAPDCDLTKTFNSRWPARASTLLVGRDKPRRSATKGYPRFASYWVCGKSAMSERHGTSENDNRRRLDQMEDLIQSMITLILEQGKLYDRQHAQTMEEIRELLNLQKEQRIDIMALFQL